MVPLLLNLKSTCPPVKKIFNPRVTQGRHFWEYVNMMFNKPDSDRIKEFGPDRICAEWVLRNGGKIVWDNGNEITDYNLLPAEHHPVRKVGEIDATSSSISHYGFSHLIGCTELKRIILHNNDYIDDRALQGLCYARDSLLHLQISRCCNVTDDGLLSLKVLEKLKTLILFELISVENLDACKTKLQASLPNCQIK